MEINEYLPKCGSWNKFYARKARIVKLKEAGLIVLMVALIAVGGVSNMAIILM